MKSDNPGLEVYEYQPPAVLNQAAPVQNTWYPLLGTLVATEKNVVLYEVNVNVEDADETLEVQFILDGQTIPASPFAASHSINYFCIQFGNSISRVVNVVLKLSPRDAYGTYPIFAREAQIQVRKTTALGAGNLTGVAMWGVKKHA